MSALSKSLAFRQKIASLVSPLRRVRARVPFWKLGAHRIPTLWGLYRGLLRHAPSEVIRCRVRELFRQNQHLTGTEATRAKLRQGHQWRDAFQAAYEGDARMQAVLSRYDRLLKTRRDRLRLENMLREELAWQKRLKNRPMLTGSFLRATLSNRPLPRLKPQPLAITMMIKRRRAARERRALKLMAVNEWIDDLRREREFEDGLKKHATASFDPVYTGPDGKDWDGPLYSVRADLHRGFDLDTERSQTPISTALKEAIMQARRDKIANKIRERAREARGEILPCTIRRKAKGPPAHVLAAMTETQRLRDKVVRSSASEVGYVGKMKRQLGWNLKNPEAWKSEGGWEQAKERLDRDVQRIAAENLRRRKRASGGAIS
ncbi:hypothetical protein PC9H_006193 [Pleurotus ostreatus]|uniref:Complex 1 LYR protein domain-containing protein n=1 Tax=Pleurotus ostreatus TaxID=5322 RepID=A0A8H7DR99_PLEOS|nr:uncharacterized protein PC9H_006193 [Pleurotus ostreatus]KAF7430485.1 hypothetical protein PC9H_006193 [Pleurotus ostreatus]